METHLPDFLLGAGMLGMLAVFFLGSLFAFFLPIWALIDVAASNRESGFKIAIIVLMVFFWGAAAFFYAVFLTSSSALRRTTLLATVMALVVSVVGLSSVFTGGSMAWERDAKVREQERQQAEAKLAARQRTGPDGVADAPAEPTDAPKGDAPVAASTKAPLGDFAPFWAVSKSGPGTTWVKVTPEGFDVQSARPLPPQVEHAVELGDKLYAISTHEVGHIEGRRLREIDTKDLKEFSWPAAILKSGHDRLLVITSHVHTNFIELSTDGRDRKVLASVRGPTIHAAARSPKGVIYALADTQRSLEKLYKFAPSGAVLGEVALDPKLPLRKRVRHAHLTWAGDGLLLVLNEVAQPPVLLAIDPDSGALFRRKWTP